MRVGEDGSLHLTYCTNIHAADGWSAVYDTLRQYAPALKQRLSPNAPFGIGLRLGARDATELLAGNLDDFKAFLDREGLYVALINGFPYGTFHGGIVKAEVYAPDWREEARVAYTCDLITILDALLPPGVDGGISTAPLSYKAWMPIQADADWKRVARNVARVALEMARVQRASGRIIHLDIEPEPDCAIENTDEMLAFFDEWLLPYGASVLTEGLGIRTPQAEAELRTHVRVCFDCCHASVEYEDVLMAIERLRRAGLGIGRVQLSSALTAPLPTDAAQLAAFDQRLRPFADATYLHQVIQKRDGVLEQFPDLPAALKRVQPGSGEWRVHFHVPLFTAEYDGLGSTQADVRRVIAAARRLRFTQHLEIETYTWDVPPAPLKLDLLDSISREYDWVLSQLR